MITCPDTPEDSAILERAANRSVNSACISLLMQWADRHDAQAFLGRERSRDVIAAALADVTTHACPGCGDIEPLRRPGALCWECDSGVLS